jgi:citrate lyase subunit beta/citryl-CoA lyase
MGFDGKTLIHPKQVGPCNRVFTPKPQDVAWSRRIIEAHAAATARGEGVVVVDGRLVENLHVESARRVVGMADAIAAMEAANA